METLEYRTTDKSEWARGEWDHEPDKMQWRDEATGLPCLIVRGPCGAWCGYVGVPVGHPWHGVDYDNVGKYQPKPEDYDPDWYPEVHGGLTFASACSHGDQARTVCHVPAPGEPDDVWWLGFDCSHSGDQTNMSYPAHMRERWPHSDDVYRNVDYVRGEVRSLARQAVEAASVDTHPEGGDAKLGSVSDG